MTFNRRFYGAARLAVCANLLLPCLCPAQGFYLGTSVGSGFERLDCAGSAHCDQGTASWQRGPWSITAMLGLADNIARSLFTDYPTRDHNGTTAAAGAEVSYRIGVHWRVGLEDQYRPSVALTDHTRASVNALLAGFSYEFGR